MSLIKDGKIYRTHEEQLLHLTEKHLEQVSFNENVSRKLQELTVASNLGGYNLVRYSFSNEDSFTISDCIIKSEADLSYLTPGDFVVFNSFNPDDIPAYGIVLEDKTIDFIFRGDYAEERQILICRKSGDYTGVEYLVSMESSPATNLGSLVPENYKKQVFTVLHDRNYGCRTQYVSYDVNGDGKYEFVYIGVDQNGKDGRSIYATNNDTYDSVKNILQKGDLVLVFDNVSSIINYETKSYGSSTGDVFEFVSGNEFIFKGSILGPVGPRGEKGEKGEQGLQGIQGIQGVQGEKGQQGERGKDGNILTIKTGVLNSVSQLPSFEEAKIGDAYRIINTSGSIITYDLYFKASDGTDWDIQPNWGGIKGDKGDKGDQGVQGIQGVQGEQGPKGNDGASGLSGQVYSEVASFYHTVINFKTKATSLDKAIVKLNVYNFDNGFGRNGIIEFGIVGENSYFTSQENGTHQLVAVINESHPNKYRAIVYIHNGEVVRSTIFTPSEVNKFKDIINSCNITQTGNNLPVVYCEVIPLS